MVGFCEELVKPEPAGPVHSQVTVIVLAVVAPNTNVESVQIGVLAVTTGRTGVESTTTFIVAGVDTQETIVTVTV